MPLPRGGLPLRSPHQPSTLPPLPATEVPAWPGTLASPGPPGSRPTAARRCPPAAGARVLLGTEESANPRVARNSTRCATSSGRACRSSGA
eukprot:10537181-Alexandrium_andersonii.AAC.1